MVTQKSLTPGYYQCFLQYSPSLQDSEKAMKINSFNYK